jgi:hypothetical protein
MLKKEKMLTTDDKEWIESLKEKFRKSVERGYVRVPRARIKV